MACTKRKENETRVGKKFAIYNGRDAVFKLDLDFVERNKSGQELPFRSIFIPTNVYYDTINRVWDDIRHHVTLWSDCKLHFGGVTRIDQTQRCN